MMSVGLILFAERNSPSPSRGDREFRPESQVFRPVLFHRLAAAPTSLRS